MEFKHSETASRSRIISATRRIVIKVGTRLLTGAEGCSKEERAEQLMTEIAGLRQRGMEVILVSSGAIGAGMNVLDVRQRPVQLPRLQALAAVGQLRLMALYQAAAQKHHFHCAQVLLCADDVQDRQRHLNTAFCIDTLLNEGVLPIVNENDSVSVDEIKFGDNDRLAAMVAMLARADLTVFLTSVDGLRETKNRRMTRRISLIPEFTDEIRKMALDTQDRNTSTGGMISKLEAAESLTKAGDPAWIADGRDFSVLSRIAEGRDVGTLCLPANQGRMPSRKRYLAFFSEPAGSITVDYGAARALQSRQGASLLPRGVVDCQNCFERGDTVRVLDPDNNEIGRGICNYSGEDLKKIKGLHTREINQTLECEAYDCVIHRNYLVLTKPRTEQPA